MTILDEIARIQGHILELENTIASGALTVSYEGKSTTFRSLSDLIRIKTDLQNQLNTLLGLGGRNKQLRVNTQKGL